MTAADCGDDNDPCTVAACTDGKCSVVAGIDYAPCGNDPTKTYCKGGVCIGCEHDVDCDATTECKTWTCSAKKECVATNGPTGLFQDPTGDCTTLSCSADGVLVAVAASNDPPPSDSDDCTDDTCDGMIPVHPLKAVGSNCGEGPKCGGGEAIKEQDTCDANGVCQPGAITFCVPFACDTGTGTCATDCTPATEAQDCAGPYYCMGTTCVAKAAAGKPCTSANECSTVSCTDDVCCPAACDSACVTCNISGGMAGTCAALPKGIIDSCGAGQACTGGGACANLNGKKAVGETCATETDCFNNVSGSPQCVLGLCRLNNGSDCSAILNTSECSSNLCKDGTCQSCANDADCPSGKCDMASMRCLLGAMTKCGDNDDCISGTCTANLCQ